jgi:phosphoenolpyruvate carboxykinase (ATP)
MDGVFAMFELDLSAHGITVKQVLRNAPPYQIYLAGLRSPKNTTLATNGALVAYTGEKTGRIPKDKRIVERPTTKGDVWWGAVNMPRDPNSAEANLQRAKDFFNLRERLFVVDGYAGWAPKYRIKVRVICARAYHALFMWNMLIRPTREELAEFGEPDAVIYNAGLFPADPFNSASRSRAVVDLDLDTLTTVILGTL